MSMHLMSPRLRRSQPQHQNRLARCRWRPFYRQLLLFYLSTALALGHGMIAMAAALTGQVQRYTPSNRQAVINLGAADGIGKYDRGRIELISRDNPNSRFIAANIVVLQVNQNTAIVEVREKVGVQIDIGAGARVVLDTGSGQARRDEERRLAQQNSAGQAQQAELVRKQRQLEQARRQREWEQAQAARIQRQRELAEAQAQQTRRQQELAAAQAQRSRLQNDLATSSQSSANEARAEQVRLQQELQAALADETRQQRELQAAIAEETRRQQQLDSARAEELRMQRQLEAEIAEADIRRQQELQLAQAAEARQQRELQAAIAAETRRQEEIQAAQAAEARRQQELAAAQAAEVRRQQELEAAQAAEITRQQELQAALAAEEARRQQAAAQAAARQQQQQAATQTPSNPQPQSQVATQAPPNRQQQPATVQAPATSQQQALATAEAEEAQREQSLQAALAETARRQKALEAARAEEALRQQELGEAQVAAQSEPLPEGVREYWQEPSPDSVATGGPNADLPADYLQAYRLAQSDPSPETYYTFAKLLIDYELPEQALNWLAEAETAFPKTKVVNDIYEAVALTDMEQPQQALDLLNSVHLSDDQLEAELKSYILTASGDWEQVLTISERNQSPATWNNHLIAQYCYQPPELERTTEVPPTPCTIPSGEVLAEPSEAGLLTLQALSEDTAVRYPDDPYVLNTLGFLALQVEDYGGAFKYYEQLAKLLETDAAEGEEEIAPHLLPLRANAINYISNYNQNYDFLVEQSQDLALLRSQEGRSRRLSAIGGVGTVLAGAAGFLNPAAAVFGLARAMSNFFGAKKRRRRLKAERNTLLDQTRTTFTRDVNYVVARPDLEPEPLLEMTEGQPQLRPLYESRLEVK
ncbi:MAG: hypothetical protein F6K19_29885 [Cyanothece sp. SIO1E1]|nr:hypothetical protein [Cyanothece sp. SIO1E1]